MNYMIQNQNLESFQQFCYKFFKILNNCTKYCDQNIICTPADRCACEQMLEDLRESEEWINSLPGEASSCKKSE